MVMRIGGLASGMDIDELVNKLMQAERAPLNKAFQKRQVYEWQRDAYRSVNTKLKAFDTFLFDKMIRSGKMNQKTATSSNENLVAVKANPGASGNIVIGGVSQLASAAQAVGAQTAYTGSSKLSELGLTTDKITLQSIGVDGRLSEGTTIAINENMTVNDFVKNINNSNAGVTAFFEGGKLSLTAKNTGSEKSGQGEIVVTEGLDLFNKLGFNSTDGKLAKNGKNAMFEVNGIQTERSSNTFTISGYEMTLKQTFNGGDIAVKQEEAARIERDNARTALGDNNSGLTKAYIDAVNRYYGTSYSDITQVKDAVSNGTLPESSFKTNFEAAYNGKFTSVLSESEKNIYKDFVNKDRIGNLTNEQIQLIKDNDLEALKGMDEFKSFNEGDLARLKDNEGSIENFRARVLQESDERLYNATNKNLLTNDDALNFIKGLTGKTTNEIKNEIDALAEGDLKNLLKSTNTEQLQFLAQDSGRLDDFKAIATEQIKYQTEQTAFTSAKSAFEAGEQRVKYAEQAYKNAQDAVSANPPGGATVAPVTMQAKADTNAAKEQIVEFVTKYNEMIDEFNKLLKENKYRDFAPLTDEQRKDMSESEQKLWDEKAKSGLLRNDPLIRDGIAKMRSTFIGNVAGLGDKLMDSLAEIGITTSKDMKESGKLIINEDKLDAALAKDPEQVHKIFNQTGEVKEITDADGRKVVEDSRGIAYRLRGAMDSLTKGIERKAGREGMTDQTHNLGRSIVDTNKRIEVLQAKLKMVEARYWKQFGAMESAINKANQQSAMFFPGMGQQ